MRKSLPILSLLLSVLMSGCLGVRSTAAPPPATTTPTAPPSPPSAPLDQPFELGLGDSVSIAQTDLAITFVEVVEESRCPVEAECIWAGQVVIRLAMVYAGQEAGTATLTLGDGGESDQGQTSLQGYTIQLEDVLPYPSLETQNDPVVAVLRVTAGQ